MVGREEERDRRGRAGIGAVVSPFAETMRIT